MGMSTRGQCSVVIGGLLHASSGPPGARFGARQVARHHRGDEDSVQKQEDLNAQGQSPPLHVVHTRGALSTAYSGTASGNASHNHHAPPHSSTGALRSEQYAFVEY